MNSNPLAEAISVANGTTQPRSLNIASTHDVHLGHPNTPTEHILRTLRAMFPDNPTTGDLDIIFFAGDLFDRLLNLPDDNVSLIKQWFVDFLHMCARRDIVVRMLEGTPSHDWKQPRMLVEQADLCGIPVDIKYVPDLSIEYMERFGIHVLYVPDEWRPRCDDTWLEVQTLLQQHQLDKVDFAVMHGAFHYQMPKNIHHQLELHDADRYLSIVRYNILIGHIHQYSSYDRILAGGSPERLCHGDEGKKGHWRVVVDRDGVPHPRFVVNEKAMRYDTLDCVGLEGEALHALVEERVGTLPLGSHIRLKTRKHDYAMEAIDLYRGKYPGINWTVKEVKGDKDEDKPVLIDGRTKFKGITITAENISELLTERLKSKLTPDQLARCQLNLKGVVDG